MSTFSPKRAFLAVLVLAAAAVLAAGATRLQANTESFNLTNFDAGDGPGHYLDATVTFTTALNQVTVTIQNTSPNTLSDKESIYSVEFQLLDVAFPASSGSYHVDSSTPVDYQRTVSTGGVYTDTSSELTNPQLTQQWQLTTYGSGPNEYEAKTTQNQDLIIGPPNDGSLYSDANASVTGKHNPWLAPTAVFTLDIPGLTTDTTISTTGVTLGHDTQNDITTPLTPAPVPEPATVALFAIGGAALLLRRRRKVASPNWNTAGPAMPSGSQPESEPGGACHAGDEGR